MRKLLASKLIVATIAFMAIAGMPQSGAAAPAASHTQTCGGIEYAVRAQRETVSRPGLTAPRLYYDGPDRDAALDDTFASWRGRNDVINSPFLGPDANQFRPVAEQIGVICQGDQAGLLVRLLHWGDIEGGNRRRDYDFADYEADHVLTPDLEYSEATGDGEWLERDEFAILLPQRNPGGKAKPTLVVGEVFDFDVVIDPSLDVRLPEVEGFDANDPPRPAGRAHFGNGRVAEYVLDELMVLAPDDATLQAIVNRWGAEIVDQSPPDREGRFGALIRIDPVVLDEVDASALAENLLLLEPDHRGTTALSSERLAQLFAVAIIEIAEHRSVVAPNALLRGDSIASGSTTEGPVPKGLLEFEFDAFQWNFIRDDAPTMRTGVGRAWQVMEATVGFDEKKTVMIVDGGFVHNPDLPANTIIRQTEWGTPNPITCGSPCPWHGTYSATTAVAAVDNAYGTAGPAGPIADLVLVGVFKEDYKTLRRTRDMVAQYRPAVVNMSFSAAHWAFRKATEELKDIYFKEMTQLGALLFASSGNDGINVDATISGDETPTILPCESQYVVCVGGLTPGGGHHGGANYGTQKGNRTVEIHGPMCTFGLFDPSDPFNVAMKNDVCGTSESSPFVAGVAALVMSANPNLSPTEVRDLLYTTAHVGAPFQAPLPGGYDRRINAFDAVVSALGIELAPPALTILNPADGIQIAKDSLLDVRAIAEDTFDRALSIRWESDVDGFLATTQSGVFTAVALTPGAHLITARATDFRGVSTHKTVGVTVGFSSQMTILTPLPGSEAYVGQTVAFSAASYDPDTFGPLPDGLVQWIVSKNGVDLWGAFGHFVTAPANVFTPGLHHVEVFGYDDDGTVSAKSNLTILALPPGESPPVAHITAPAANVDVDSEDGEPVAVAFVGNATDAQDGLLSGTRLRWTALSDKGTKKVLCVGTHVPNQGDGGIVLPQDCTSIEVEFGPDQGAAITTWLVTLEAYDSAGLVGKRHRTVTVNVFTG